MLATPYLACLATVGQDIVLQSVTLTGTAVPIQSKSLTSLLGEGKSLTQVKLDLVNGEQSAVSVSADSTKKNVLHLQTSGFTLYRNQVPATSKLFLVPYEKNNILLRALFTDGVRTISCIYFSEICICIAFETQRNHNSSYLELLT